MEEILEPRMLEPATPVHRNGAILVSDVSGYGVPATSPPLCIAHGAAAPQVREAAIRRLLAGADLAIDYLIGVLTPRPPCVHCGRSDDDRNPVCVAAAKAVLKDSGISMPLQVEVQAVVSPLENLNAF